MQISTILAALGLAPTVTAPAVAMPASAVRNNARVLAVSCETSIRAGKWIVDAARDPDADLAALNAALMRLDEAEIARCGSRLANTAVAAIAAGDWIVDGESLSAIIDAGGMVAANDSQQDRVAA